MKNLFSDKSKDRRSLVLGILAFVFLAAGIVVSLFFLLHAELKNESVTYELGTDISDDPAEYLDAGFLAMHFAKVDLSDVNERKPGNYEIKINCPGKAFTLPLELEDTTPPEVCMYDKELCFKQWTVLTPSDLIRNVKDADKDVVVDFVTDTKMPLDTNCLDLGMHAAWIEACDSSGNSTKVCIPYIVDLPPEFDRLCDLYVASGEDYNLLDYVSAVDVVDGDLSDKIKMTPANPDLTEGSVTELKFTVTDSYGLKTTEKVNLYVMSAGEIQSLIGTRDVTRENAIFIGAINEFDTGLFSNQSIDDTLIDVMPTVVSLSVEKQAGVSTRGSGYIIQITDTDLYVVTNSHVVISNNECEVTFYTSDHVMGTVIGHDDYYDIAVVKVSLSDLPDYFTDIISTVHIDMTYWKSLRESDHIELGLERMELDGTIDHYTYGQLVNKNQTIEFISPHIETEIDLPLQLGDSGSAVFDEQGRLICMAFAYSLYPNRYWAIPLPEIIEAYEEISGNKLYVY